MSELEWVMADPDLDRQEVEWLAHVDKCKAEGRCPHSGATVVVCKATICDCFDPYAMGADLHPEYFQIGGSGDG